MYRLSEKPKYARLASSIRGACFDNATTDGRASGFTLLEMLVAIGLTAMLLAVFSAAVTGMVFITKTTTTIQAQEFIQEEIDTLRSLPFAELLNRTDGDWLGIAFVSGDWKVQEEEADAYSGTQVLEITAPSDPVYSVTGAAILPGNYRDDFTFSAAINVQEDSPVGWDAGLAFRYRDPENYYRLRFSSGGLALDRVYQGAVTTLDTDSYSFAGDGSTWYVIEVEVAGDSIVGRRNGTTVISATDSQFTAGDLALITMDDAVAWFDDVSVTEGASTDTWQFDDAAQLGSLPDDWKRLSCLDLPNGACYLTIEDYLGESTIKQVTVEVRWSESNRTKTADGMTLISQ